ncbi:hypothetical protein ACQEWB_07260 [Streptomyces sp. CA-249302]|uniref:hypothetical protein n=1 Tax=Streptomyces sp. CA-249302 TaxID=3240058 RepID=UPI003D8B1E31
MGEPAHPALGEQGEGGVGDEVGAGAPVAVVAVVVEPMGVAGGTGVVMEVNLSG